MLNNLTLFSFFFSLTFSSAYEVIKKKGYTSWAIGLSVANMTQTLLRNQKNVHAISVLAKVGNRKS